MRLLRTARHDKAKSENTYKKSLPAGGCGKRERRSFGQKRRVPRRRSRRGRLAYQGQQLILSSISARVFSDCRRARRRRRQAQRDITNSAQTHNSKNPRHKSAADPQATEGKCSNLTPTTRNSTTVPL
uniref:Uncharacterized protein n=1 Tax=Plectus sambesii TaxID=2011161 RepID=A0A914W6X7_9BILA